MSRIAGIVLAAGGSSRMGEAKQLLPYRGRSLLRHAAEAALDAGCDPVIVVLGSQAVACSLELRNLPVHLAVNEDWPTGMASSVRFGLHTLQESDAPVDGVLFTLCDQPLVSADTLRKIIEMQRSSGARIVASSYEGTLGVPALFARDMFSELELLQGEEGARRVIVTHISEVIAVTNDVAAFDIDTPADRARLPTEF